MQFKFIDATLRREELRRLRSLSQKLRTELFESCCEIQRDADSADLDRLRFLLAQLKALDNRQHRLTRVTLLDPRD